MALDTSGNVKVDFVWGPFPMQPDDERTGSATQIGGGSGDTGWSQTTKVQSVALTKTAISKSLNNGITSLVPNNHSVALNNWNGYPDYTPVAPFLDTVDQAAIPNVVGLDESAATSALIAAGFVKGAVTETGVGATAANDGDVKTQTPAAATVANLGTAVALVKFLAPSVPDVLGLGNVAAETAIEAAGLVYAEGTTTTVGATVENDGQVASTTPAAGTKVDPGSTVTVSLYEYLG